MSELRLEADRRVITGRKVKQLRQQGLIPVVVYGNVAEPVNLQVDSRQLDSVLHSGGATQLIAVDVKGGGKHNVLVKDIQREPVSRHILTVDLYAVNMREKQRVTVPLIAKGKPIGMAAGLMLLQAHEMIHIEALPADIPAEIEIDVTPLTADGAITVADLPALKGITYADHADEVLFTLYMTRGAEAEEAVAEEEAAAEPEVVKRGKQTEEEQ
jgi:large subunit ribosomal protein L25